MPNTLRKKDILRRIEDYEANRLTENEEVNLFQKLIDLKLIKELGDKFERVANNFVVKGMCKNG